MPKAATACGSSQAKCFDKNDGTVIESYTPHIHIHNGINDKTAYPLPDDFSNTNDIVQTLRDFLSYSNVINVNEIELYEQGVLFDVDQQ